MLDGRIFNDEILIKCRTEKSYKEAITYLKSHNIVRGDSFGEWNTNGGKTVLEFFDFNDKHMWEEFSSEDYDNNAQFYTLKEFKEKFEIPAEPKVESDRRACNEDLVKAFLPDPEEAQRPMLEVREITTNGVSVTVSIDYKLKTVSLVEYVNSKDIRGKEWKFVGRGTSYQKGWKDILEAMEVAMDYGFNKLKGAE